jgi:magnesium chelatase family protein
MTLSKQTTAKLYCAELEGIVSRLIEVEVDLHPGLVSFSIVGLGDKAVSEAKERVTAAIKNCGMKPPNRQNRKMTVNLAPADIKKNGSQYDVPIALGYLVASQQMAPFSATHRLFLGELALDGSVRPVRGALNACLMARTKGIEEVFVPLQNMREVRHLSEPRIVPISHLRSIVPLLEGKVRYGAYEPEEFTPQQPPNAVDVSEIRGQSAAKRTLAIAAAGGHNLLMSGPPGAGKTMLARSLVSILPNLTFGEALELTQIYSAAGLLPEYPFLSYRPFRSPHHSASLVSVVGGGTNPKPGEISLAHCGVLFMDEFPEFHRDVLESLRQPLESGFVVVARAKTTIVLPSKFMLVAAANPCPCGYYQDEEKECVCSPHDIHKYQKKLSGPLLDRIDLHIWVPRIKSEDLKKEADKKESWVIKNRVDEARVRQRERFKKSGFSCHANAELTSKQATELIVAAPGALRMLDKLLDEARVSARGYFKLLKVAQTIADLDELEQVDERCVQEAFSYRLRNETN